MKCKYFRFMLEVFSMRKLSFLALVLAMCLCLGACSSGEAPSVPEEPTTAVPEYSFINSDRYVQNGTTGIGYRVAIGDGANDIPMIQAAGTGIAFCAKPKTREAAPFAIDERNLMLAMDIILRD